MATQQKGKEEQNIIQAPAPWQLNGKAYISAFRCEERFLSEQSFLPQSLQPSRKGTLAYLMFVDYFRSDVGPYHELLFIPGSAMFADGKRHLTISRIFVSSLASVVNGQANWGIPKDVAEFKVEYGDDGVDNIDVNYQGEFMASLSFKKLPLSLPAPGQLIPKRFRSLGQHYQGKTYTYTPSAKGRAQLTRMQSCAFNQKHFPDLSQQQHLGSVHLKHFDMQFPVADILDTI